MPNTQSNIKRVRSVKAKTARNSLVRSRLKTAIKNARTAISGSDKAAAESTVMTAVQELDRAAQKKVIHKNNAARRKSRLMKQLNGMEA